MNNRPVILVIDDDENVLKLLKVNFVTDGYEVRTASSGLDGIKIFEQQGPELIILDIMMPVMDGIQTLKLIREKSRVPVIVLTSLDDVDTLQKALNLGADDYITKPFSHRELSARIRSKLRRPP